MGHQHTYIHIWKAAGGKKRWLGTKCNECDWGECSREKVGCTYPYDTYVAEWLARIFILLRKGFRSPLGWSSHNYCFRFFWFFWCVDVEFWRRGGEGREVSDGNTCVVLAQKVLIWCQYVLYGYRTVERAESSGWFLSSLGIGCAPPPCPSPPPPRLSPFTPQSSPSAPVP